MAKKSQPEMVEVEIVVPIIYFTVADVEVRADGAVHIALAAELRDFTEADRPIQPMIVGRLVTTAEAGLTLSRGLQEALLEYLSNGRKKG